MDDIRPSEMKKIRHLILLVILIGCLKAVLAGPNVLLVVTDDQGYGDMSCHGNPDLMTPEIDRLHGESVRLTDFHVDPTCSPTRAALLTGRYATTGQLPADPTTHNMRDKFLKPANRTLSPVRASLQIGNAGKSMAIRPHDKEADFMMNLPRGQQRLQASFENESGDSTSAYYVYMEPASGSGTSN